MQFIGLIEFFEFIEYEKPVKPNKLNLRLKGAK